MTQKTETVYLYLQKSNDSIFPIPFVYCHTSYIFSYFYEYLWPAKSGKPEKCVSLNHAILPQNNLENQFKVTRNKCAGSPTYQSV